MPCGFASAAARHVLRPAQKRIRRRVRAGEFKNSQAKLEFLARFLAVLNAQEVTCKAVADDALFRPAGTQKAPLHFCIGALFDLVAGAGFEP
ncbi:MAG: hypothetical protein ACT6WE_32580, partial [Shinella sp.]|uniref:hypothetical protein n=1 Tax=Shinella sp. TaxID=1870904 RepID=UPI004036E68C